MGSILCEHCPAACCRYLAIEIDKPKTQRDHDDIRWFILHEGITVFVEEGSWYIQIQTRCKQLGLNNLCQIYDTRPEICRDYEPGECDYCVSDSGYEHHFTHASQLETYYFEKTGRRLGQSNDKPRRLLAKGARKGTVRAKGVAKRKETAKR
jgi:Fe-S-cluster containining protein